MLSSAEISFEKVDLSSTLPVENSFSYQYQEVMENYSLVYETVAYETALPSENSSSISVFPETKVINSNISLFFNIANSSALLNGDHQFEEQEKVTFFQMLLSYLVAISFFLCILQYWWYHKNYHFGDDPSSDISHLPLPPGSFGFPFIGETLQWILQGSEFNARRRKKFGNVFKTNIAISGMTVRVSGREYVKKILLGEHEKVTTIWPTNLRRILGENGMINSAGAVHRMKRKITCKAFTTAALNRYIPLFKKSIRNNVNSLSNSKHAIVYDSMLRLTFDLAAIALLGLDAESLNGNKLINAFHTMIKNLFSIPVNLPGTGFSKSLKARATILELLQDHISQMKKTLMRQLIDENGKIEDSDANDSNSAFEIIIREMLLENMKNSQKDEFNNNDNNQSKENYDEVETIDDLTLKEMAMELIFAGYYTSGSTLTSCVLELARHPKVLRKLEEELVENGLMAEKGDTYDDNDDVNIDLNRLHKLTYLDQVLKETLRLRPPILGAFRKAKKTFELGGYRIPKGCHIVYNIRDTHEMEYEGLDEFDPEKFAPGKSSDDKFRFIPFGGGPRMCIGQEYARIIIKLTLIELIRTYRGWDLANGSLPKMGFIPTLHPVDGLPCVFHSREKFGIVSH